MTTRTSLRLEAARALRAGRDSADTTPTRLPFYGNRPVHNLCQVEARLLHAAGQMATARGTKRRLDANPDRFRWYERIIRDCVATARAERRWARAHANGGGR